MHTLYILFLILAAPMGVAIHIGRMRLRAALPPMPADYPQTPLAVACHAHHCVTGVTLGQFRVLTYTSLQRCGTKGAVRERLGWERVEAVLTDFYLRSTENDWQARSEDCTLALEYEAGI